MSGEFPVSHLEVKILDKLDNMADRLSSMEKTIIKLESDIRHHMDAEDSRETLVAALNARLQALEAVQLQAKGAATMARFLWAVALVLTGVAGWFVRHFGFKP